MSPPDYSRLPAPTAEPSDRWVRVHFGGETIADCKRPMLLLQYGPRGLPTYFFPPESVRTDLLVEAGEDDWRRLWTVRAGGREAVAGAWSLSPLREGLEALADHITFDWDAMDAWYEEEEEVFVHARDPYKRVDVMPSSRHVEVSLDGQVIADSRRTRMLFETHLPVRYYFPREDVRMDLLVASERITRCPYKGTATYWSVEPPGGRPRKDLVWTYEHPIPECPKIAGLLAFFNERVDLRVDGEPVERPRTPWS